MTSFFQSITKQGEISGKIEAMWAASDGSLLEAQAPGAFETVEGKDVAKDNVLVFKGSVDFDASREWSAENFQKDGFMMYTVTDKPAGTSTTKLRVRLRFKECHLDDVGDRSVLEELWPKTMQLELPSKVITYLAPNPATPSGKKKNTGGDNESSTLCVAGKIFEVGSESSERVRKEVIHSLFIRRVMQPLHLKLVLGQDGRSVAHQVKGQEGCYLEQLKYFASLRIHKVGAQGTLAVADEFNGVVALMNMSNLKILQPEHIEEFNKFIMGKGWNCGTEAYKDLSFDYFLPAWVKIDYNSRRQLIEKLSNFQDVMGAVRGVRFRDCAEALIQRIRNSEEKCRAYVAYSHYLTHDAYGRFCIQVAEVERTTLTTSSGIKNIDNAEGCAEALKQLFMEVAEFPLDFETYSFWQSTIERTLLGAPSADTNAQRGRGNGGGGKRNLNGVANPITPPPKKRKYSALCLGDAAHYYKLKVGSTGAQPCRFGGNCKFEHISAPGGSWKGASEGEVAENVRKSASKMSQSPLGKALLQHFENK